MEEELMYAAKLAVCIAYDFFDFTVGRLLFVTPFAGEIIGCVLCCMLFGLSGVLYGLEALDPTEQLDGFVPTATLIALKNRPVRQVLPRTYSR
jgi:hypothetical protein